MQEKINDLIYSARQLCEILNDRQELLDDELVETLEEVEKALEVLSDSEELEDLA